ncbi:Gfo/Idh/MocA family protein [Paenibacillus allorhizosphaerae]|uniref:Inositol 2-dehydrogenase/D-chiro-inositol 3-dehydrogenase n=1 Tax=Paenibacillus allorhizosphaerae TaxID=2849866 RepID=A0ABM8VTA9_9BACL|nr:Gfo/Idh/MocA family oxidoreductase [Paenibacillus allorhizosphaerae]CAG7657589.1 Inositol 2-dehydrogenase/D-chiro-inositol 3-dehydrogenase [Paenibacillus allorhizosphaerae]
MSKKLKWGIVGAGAIFRGAHVKPLKEHPEVEIVAVCDINEAKAKQAASDYGISAVYTDYRELLRRDDIDVIDICTPNLYHSEIAIAALRAGKHVFCEKPDAVSPEEAQKMADAAKESSRTLMVMRNNRFTPAARYLKAYIEQGQMGEIYAGRCGWIRRRGIPGKGGWFTTKELSGGGPLIDLGVHFIDLAVWLMGNPRPVAVSGATYTKFANNELSDSAHSQFGEKQEGGTFDVEDLAIGFIRFDNGAALQIEFSWASNIGEEMNFIELRGTQSGAHLKKGELSLFSETAGQLTNITPVLPSAIGALGHAEHLRHFIDCLHNRAEPINTPEHGVDMIKILNAIYESGKTGKEVRL